MKTAQMKKQFSRILAVIMVSLMFFGFLPVTVWQVIADSAKSDNQIPGPVEDWVYTPSDEIPVMFMEESRMLFAARKEEASASDIVNVHVTAINKTTGLEESVPGATVRLMVDGVEKDSDITDASGNATVSLAGLTIEEKYTATISADKVVSRGQAIDGSAKDDFYNKYYPKEDGEYYRYTMELHSEWIDRNGNWNGTLIPKIASSDKVDMVFAIDTTGSMSDEINNVKNNIADFAQSLINEGLDIRFCIIEYLDITTHEPTYVHTLNGSRWYSDINSVVTVLDNVKLGNGGDWEETPIDALGEIADTAAMNYRSDAHKFAFVLTDAGYKNNNRFGYANMGEISRALAGLNIVTSVITTNSEKSIYSTLYNTTGGIYANIYARDFNAEMLKLSDSIVQEITREVNLTLSEPRMLVNMSVCYFADDANSKSVSYKASVKNMLNEYSHRLAETTDGHVFIDKIVLFSTDNRLDFYNTNSYASMADIRIESEVNDDGTFWNNVTIHSNAHVAGFFFDDTYTAVYDGWDETEAFSHLKGGKELNGRQSFFRIQMSGTEGAGWNNSLIDDAYAYSTTLAHETGHYLFGFLDEYLNADDKNWRKVGGKPYSAYGLMDNQHTDIEMSKTPIDYSYMNGDFRNTAKPRHTAHSWYYKESCEDWLADFLTNETQINNKWSNAYGNKAILASSDLDYKLAGKYQAVYTKASGNTDRTATYAYAGLTNADYISATVNRSSTTFDLRRSLSATVATDYFETFEFTTTSLGDIVMKGNGSTISFEVTPKAGYTYSLFHRESNDEAYNVIEMTKSGDKYVAELPVDVFELAEIRLVAEESGKSSYNVYYVERSGLCEVGYLYFSADYSVMAYIKAQNSAYTFVADNTAYTNGDYFSVNQATIISRDIGVAIESGEIYSVASYMAEIDYSTLSWFKYKDGVWTKLSTDYSEEENMNIGARADIDGEGVYVLMAKKIPADKTAISPKNLTYTQSTNRDAVITLSFRDTNIGSKYYNVYYSESRFVDKNADGVVVRSFSADSTDLTLDLIERGREVYVAVEVVLEDGTRSPLSTLLRVKAGEADSDRDGIPDWYCDKYHLWGEDGEVKNIANSDDDGDGLTNLEEFRGGSDPTNPNDPLHTTNIPVTSVTVSPTKITLGAGLSKTVTAVIEPTNATNLNVTWSVEDPTIAAIHFDGTACTITGITNGTTTVYVVTADGGYSASVTVTVSGSHDHETSPGEWMSNADEHWKICICGVITEAESHSFARIANESTKVPGGQCGRRDSYYKSCGSCGYLSDETFEFGDIRGHSFTNYVSDGNASCRANGTKTAKCDYCNAKDTKIDVGSKKPHTFTNYVSDGNATCVKEGTKTAKCELCPATDTQPDVGTQKPHRFTNYVSDGNATCESDGTKTAKCINCSTTDTQPDVGTKKAHRFTNYISDGNATCQTDGTKTAKCNNCSVTDTKTAVGSKTTHRFTNYVSDGNATCQADGTKTAKCDYCKTVTDTQSDVGSKTTHRFTNYIPDGNATCVKEGTKTAKCDFCEATDTQPDVNNQNAHKFTNYVSDGNATCVKEGTKTAKCDFCEATDTQPDVGSKTPHSFTNYVSDGNATCDADGTMTAQCDYCDAKDTQTDVDSKTEHDFEDGICINCGAEEPSQFTTVLLIALVAVVLIGGFAAYWFIIRKKF